MRNLGKGVTQYKIGLIPILLVILLITAGGVVHFQKNSIPDVTEDTANIEHGDISAVHVVEAGSSVTGQIVEDKGKDIKKIRKRLRDIFGKTSLVLALALSSIYFIRAANKGLYNNQNSVLTVINGWLKKNHKLFGVLVVFLGMIHGICSKTSVFSINWGSVCWVLSVMLVMNYTIRDKLRLPMPWIFYHRILAFIFMVVLAVHFFSED